MRWVSLGVVDGQKLNGRLGGGQGVTARTVRKRIVRKWRHRFAAEGEPGVAGRSPRPRHSPRRHEVADRGDDCRVSPPALVRY
ncbi:hypothetical protein D3874_22095 [Oleomonas cavernae]|uniref:Uncharacterized protein n=1 Tax=Oleomonas cavernae TaxID=2320859 RepID=A0A418WH91_9PROT|nr:hypothetical protein D3874_22095 [Oleomonas cavernae]